MPTGRRSTLAKKDVGADNQEKVAYAYRLGGENFVYLLNAENGQWTFKRRHDKAYQLCHKADGSLIDQRESSLCNTDKKNYYWKTHYDYGFCGISDGYQEKTYKDHRMFTDWKWQMQECYRLYKSGTTFYGANHIAKQKQFFYYTHL